MDKRESSPSPTNKNKGIMNRSSRFSEVRMKKFSIGSSYEERDLRPRLSIEDIEKEPLGTPMNNLSDNSPKSKRSFFKKRNTLVLTPAQLELLDDKIIKSSRNRERTRSFSTTIGGKNQVRRSKLLQRISNIAARGSIASVETDNANNPAIIFKQLLVINLL